MFSAIPYHLQALEDRRASSASACSSAAACPPADKHRSDRRWVGHALRLAAPCRPHSPVFWLRHVHVGARSQHGASARSRSPSPPAAAVTMPPDMLSDGHAALDDHLDAYNPDDDMAQLASVRAALDRQLETQQLLEAHTPESMWLNEASGALAAVMPSTAAGHITADAFGEGGAVHVAAAHAWVVPPGGSLTGVGLGSSAHTAVIAELRGSGPGSSYRGTAVAAPPEPLDQSGTDTLRARALAGFGGRAGAAKVVLARVRSGGMPQATVVQPPGTARTHRKAGTSDSNQQALDALLSRYTARAPQRIGPASTASTQPAAPLPEQPFNEMTGDATVRTSLAAQRRKRARSQGDEGHGQEQGGAAQKQQLKSLSSSQIAASGQSKLRDQSQHVSLTEAGPNAPADSTTVGKPAANPAAVRKGGRKARDASGQGGARLEDVVVRHGLPPEVAAAVLEAAAGGKGGIPADARYVDALLARVTTDDLGVPHETVLAVLRRCPGVLKQSSGVLRDKAQRLGELLGLPARAIAGSSSSSSDGEEAGHGSAARHVGDVLVTVPRLWGLTVENVRAKVESLRELLGVAPPVVRALVAKCPVLLACAADSLGVKMAGLRALLAAGGIGPASVTRLVLECPQVLFLNRDRLAAKFRDLAVMLGVSQAELAVMAASRPLLLTSAPTTLRNNWAELRACAALSKRWRAELLGQGMEAGKQQLSLASRAALLLASRAKTRRLRYLVAAKQGEAVSMCTSVLMTAAEFNGRYPGFRVWARTHGHAHTTD